MGVVRREPAANKAPLKRRPPGTPGGADRAGSSMALSGTSTETEHHHQQQEGRRQHGADDQKLRLMSSEMSIVMAIRPPTVDALANRRAEQGRYDGRAQVMHQRGDPPRLGGAARGVTSTSEARPSAEGMGRRHRGDRRITRDAVGQALREVGVLRVFDHHHDGAVGARPEVRRDELITRAAPSSQPVARRRQEAEPQPQAGAATRSNAATAEMAKSAGRRATCSENRAKRAPSVAFARRASQWPVSRARAGAA